MHRASHLLLLPVVLLMACDDDSFSIIDTGFPVDASADVGFSDAGFPDFGFPDFGQPDPAREPVYIHTSESLYSYDPVDGEARLIGEFHTSDGPFEIGIVDIAIDLNGRMYGGDRAGDGANGDGWNNIYTIDPYTAFCEPLFRFQDQLHGLTVLDDGRLVVAGRNISLVDPVNGTMEREMVSDVYETSGDIVGLPDGKLYWTVRGENGGDPDRVVKIDPDTGDFTLVGDAGIDRLFGLGYAEGALYGFSSDGEVVKLNPQTGAVIEQTQLEGAWWGATTNPVLW